MKFQSTRQHLTTQSLTVYNDGFGLVKEMREIPGNKEVTEIQFLDVSPEIEADSVLIEGLHILEQSYNSDLISKEKLLEKYIGQVVTVRNAELDEEMKLRLLSVSDSIIAERTDTKEIVIDPIGQLILPALPKELLIRPALVCKIATIESDTIVKISYLTQGLEWQANYVAKIRGSKLDLTGWIQLSNNSGMSFPESQLKLAAGKVNRYMDVYPLTAQTRLFSATEEPESVFKKYSFADSHIYSINYPVDILHEQTKQINFLEIQEVIFKKLYKVESHSEHAKLIVEFDNVAANKLGIPLPKGILKVYEEDLDGEMEFIGENVLKNTAMQQNVSIAIGEAFDIVSQSWEKTRNKSGHFKYVTYIYKLQNQRLENVQIEAKHPIFEQIWQMESSSHDYELKQSNEVEFRVYIAAGKEVEVEFTYKVDRSSNVSSK